MMWGPCDRISAFIRDTRAYVLSLSPPSPPRSLILWFSLPALWGHSDKAAIYKPGGQSKPETTHGGIWNVDY